MKESGHKRIYAPWLHLYKLQKVAKSIQYKQSRDWIYLWEEVGVYPGRENGVPWGSGFFLYLWLQGMLTLKMIIGCTLNDSYMCLYIYKIIIQVMKNIKYKS